MNSNFSKMKGSKRPVSGMGLGKTTDPSAAEHGVRQKPAGSRKREAGMSSSKDAPLSPRSQVRLLSSLS
jgi:hypothetical protein